MIQLPRYESYKDSGVQWLGEIPSHWDTTVLKFECDVRDGTHDTPEYVNFDENTYPLITSKDLVTGDISFENLKYISQEDFTQISKRSKVDFGDLLMPMIGTVGGAVLVKTKELFAIKNVALFKPTKVYANWLKYFLDSELTKIQFDLQKTGGVQSFVSLGTLRNLRLLKVPLTEQQIIADYLDKRLAQVDALIAKQETLLEKLAEQRVALISHAVTKGLNPDVEMKDSGIEWFGKIPAHWTVFNVKRGFNIFNGATPKSGEAQYWDGDIIWLTPADFGKSTDLRISDSKRKITLEGLNSCGTSLVPANSVILSTRAPIGSLAISTTEICTNQGCKSLVSKGNTLPQYLAYFLSAFNETLQLLGQGTTFLELSSDKLASFPLLKLNLQEQAEIVAFLDVETSKIDEMCQTVKHTIDKLTEYRSTLITQVVTGKIDVRKIQIK